MDYIEKRFSYLVASDLNMYYCGKRTETKNHSYGPQVRDHFLLVYIKDGNAVLTLGNKYIDLCGGQLLCMFPNEKIYYKANEGSLWSISWVGVYGSQAELYLKNLGITRSNPVYNCPQADETEKSIDDIIDMVEKNNSYGKIAVLSKLYLFFSTLFDKNAVPMSEMKSIDLASSDTHEINYLSDNLYIREAENYIRFHYDREISINSVAKSLNLSPEYFSRLFKSETGLSPQQLIIKYRLDRACVLLTATNLTISEISNSVGIPDTRYFSKLFRRNKSMSPSEYRKNHI